MLLLVTLALVVASAILLILGFVQDALGFIYLSMLCAGVAAVALFVFARLARRRGASLAGAGIASSPEAERSAADVRPTPVGRSAQIPESERRREEPSRNVAVVPAAPPPRAEGPDDSGSWWYEDEGAPSDDRADRDRTQDQPVAAAPRSVAAPDDADTWSADAPGDEDWGDEVVFPIEDYDDLRVAEILPLLNQLDPDELQEVRDRELAGKARATILDRIDDRLGRLDGPPASAVTTAGIPVVDPVGSGEPAAPGAPAFSRAASEAPVAPAPAAPSPSRARSTRKAATEPAEAPAAKQAGPAKKAAAARKAPAAKKASPSKEAAPASEPARTPRKGPARKAAAATDPVPSSGTSRRAGTARKASAESPAAATPAPAPAPAKKAAGAVPAKKAAAAKKASKSTGETASPRKAASPAKRTPRKSAD